MTFSPGSEVAHEQPKRREDHRAEPGDQAASIQTCDGISALPLIRPTTLTATTRAAPEGQRDEALTTM